MLVSLWWTVKLWLSVLVILVSFWWAIHKWSYVLVMLMLILHVLIL